MCLLGETLLRSENESRRVKPSIWLYTCALPSPRTYLAPRSTARAPYTRERDMCALASELSAPDTSSPSLSVPRKTLARVRYPRPFRLVTSKRDVTARAAVGAVKKEASLMAEATAGDAGGRSPRDETKRNQQRGATAMSKSSLRGSKLNAFSTRVVYRIYYSRSYIYRVGQ